MPPLKTTVKQKSALPTASPRISVPVAATAYDENLRRFGRMFAAQDLHQTFGQYIFSELSFAVSASSARLCLLEGDAAVGKLRFVATFGPNSEVSKSDLKLLRTCIAQGEGKHWRRKGNDHLLLPVARKGVVKGVMT